MLIMLAMPAELQQLLVDHPVLFPGFQPSDPVRLPASGANARAGHPYTDYWGSVWETPIEGFAGCITRFPLANWAAFDGYVPPDPGVSNGVLPVDWAQRAVGAERARTAGHAFGGGLTHGHTFLRLEYLRGYENLIYDMADDEPRLWQLIEMIEALSRAHQPTNSPGLPTSPARACGKALPALWPRPNSSIITGMPTTTRATR